MQTQEKQRTIKHLLDEDGVRVVHVPLADKGKKYAIVDELVFEDLIGLGLSPIWRFKKDRGRERVVVWNRAMRHDTAIARVILDAGPGQSVVHVNGNPLDLRVTNLVIGLGKGKRKERDDIRPSNRFNYRLIVKHDYEQQNQRA